MQIQHHPGDPIRAQVSAAAIARGRLATRGPGSLLALVACAVTAGCQGATSFHNAQPIPPGDAQLAGAVGTIGVFDAGESKFSPFGELRTRIGLARDVDIGVGTSGYLDQDLYTFQADVNYAFARSGDVVWSVDPTIAFGAAFDVSATVFWLPVLVDVYSTERATWTLNAKYGHVVLDGLPNDDVFENADSGDYAALGIGCRWRLWRSFSLFPEFEVVVPYNDVTNPIPLYVFGLAFVSN